MDSSGRSSMCGKITVLPGNRPLLTAARPSRKASSPPMAARLALVERSSDSTSSSVCRRSAMLDPDVPISRWFFARIVPRSRSAVTPLATPAKML